MAGSNLKSGGLSSLGIPGRGLSYITPRLKGYKLTKKKLIVRGLMIIILFCVVSFVGGTAYLAARESDQQTLTVNDLVTQTWQAQTRMANAVSTAQKAMFSGESLMIDSTIAPETAAGVISSTPSPVIE